VSRPDKTEVFKIMEKYISEAAVIVSFKQDNFVRLKQTKAEDAYKNAAGGSPSLNTNQPDTAEPSLPRIIFKDKLKGIGISQNAAQLAVRFEKKEDINKQVQTVLENVDMLFNATKEFEGESNIKDTGLMAYLIVPSPKPFNELNAYLFNSFSKFEPQGEIVNTFYRTGFKTGNNLFLGIDIGAYEQKGSKGEHFGGYNIRIDLNNRPAFEGLSDTALLQPDDIKAKFKSIIDTGLDGFLKIGLS